jgi:hypothetical protein
MTEAERVAQALRWRLSAESTQIARDGLDRLVESGHLFTPAERDELDAMAAQLPSRTSWSDVWLNHIAGMLVRDAPTYRRDELAKVVAETAFAALDRPGASVSIGTFDDGSHLLLLDRGVVFLLTALFGPLAAAWQTRGLPNDPGAPSRLRTEFRLELAARRFLPESEGGLVRHRQEPERASLAAYLLGRALVFAVAHECGHILLRHDATRSLLLAGTDVDVATDAPELELAADDFAVEVAFGDLAQTSSEDVLFVHLCAARGLLAVLTALESEVYARNGRTHPAAADRWARIADHLARRGREATVARLDRFWQSLELATASSTPLLGPDAVLEELHNSPDIDLTALPTELCGLVALADRHFVMTADEHRSVVKSTDSNELVVRAGIAIDEHVAIHPTAGLSWQALFEAAEPNYSFVPHPTTISAVRLAWLTHQ